MTNRDAVRAGVFTAIFAFVGIFAPGLIGWLSSVGEWADSDGVQPFPAFSSLGYLAVSAVAAALGGLANTLWRLGQIHGFLPGKAPTYRKP